MSEIIEKEILEIEFNIADKGSMEPLYKPQKIKDLFSLLLYYREFQKKHIHKNRMLVAKADEYILSHVSVISSNKIILAGVDIYTGDPINISYPTHQPRKKISAMDRRRRGFIVLDDSDFKKYKVEIDEKDSIKVFD
jgi:hypothetical protein